MPHQMIEHLSGVPMHPLNLQSLHFIQIWHPMKIAGWFHEEWVIKLAFNIRWPQWGCVNIRWLDCTLILSSLGKSVVMNKVLLRMQWQCHAPKGNEPVRNEELSITQNLSRDYKKHENNGKKMRASNSCRTCNGELKFKCQHPGQGSTWKSSWHLKNQQSLQW
jgi:hypothetical protein